jgi:hypothetical protein
MHPVKGVNCDIHGNPFHSTQSGRGYRSEQLAAIVAALEAYRRHCADPGKDQGTAAIGFAAMVESIVKEAADATPKA